MRTLKKLLILLGMAACAGYVSGCNTMEGAGEDLHQGWHATKDAVHDATH